MEKRPKFEAILLRKNLDKTAKEVYETYKKRMQIKQSVITAICNPMLHLLYVGQTYSILLLESQTQRLGHMPFAIIVYVEHNKHPPAKRVVFHMRA